MKITKTVELPDGKVQFIGELEGGQLDAVLTVGIETLLKLGVMPYLIQDGVMVIDDFGDLPEQ